MTDAELDAQHEPNCEAIYHMLINGKLLATVPPYVPEHRRCTVPWCDRERHSHGLCTVHDYRSKNNGDPLNYWKLLPGNRYAMVRETAEGWEEIA